MHYESLHPVSHADIEITKFLVDSYIEGNYEYQKKDIPFLISKSNETSKLEEFIMNDQEFPPLPSKLRRTTQNQTKIKRKTRDKNNGPEHKESFPQSEKIRISENADEQDLSLVGLEKRLAELREIKASDRSPLERKELNKLRNSVNHAKETEEQRNHRLENKS